MQVVVIGAGRMGAIRAVDLSADPRVTDVVIVNRTPDRAASLARELGATDVAWEDLSTLRPDAFVAALATDAHTDLLTGLLEQRVPVLCEKPIALTLEHTDEIIACAERYGTPIQIGFQRRFDPGISRARDLVVAGRLGVLYSMMMTAHDHTPSPREFIAGSGGIFRDMHVHDFDLVRWITGSEVATVYATKAVRAQHQYAEFDDADATQIQLVTVDGIQVSISGTRHDPLGHDVRMEIFGSADSVVAGLNPRTPLHSLDGDADPSASLGMNDRPYTGFVDRFREAFRVETAAFVSMVAGEAANACPPDAARESLRIAIACEESVRRGGVVHVADIGPEHRPPP
ncbi:MAG: Gfo/Idh/MocA family oxidoreductase [Actinobacteria bacterium]|nr:Gfo/Idh/MocA family oxidoreductase [Actinomycetota bacterium]